MIKISNSSVVACICEGSTEKAIIQLLIDNNKLIFDEQIDIIEIVTKPEIEMILIAYFDYMNSFKKTNHVSPSDFISGKLNLPLKEIKSYKYIYQLFENDIDGLIKAILLVTSKSKTKNLFLSDLLKNT